MCGAFLLLKILVPCTHRARCPISFRARLSGCWGGFYLDRWGALSRSCLLSPVIVVAVATAPTAATVIVVPVAAISSPAVVVVTTVSFFSVIATVVVARTGCPTVFVFVFAVMLAILLTVLVLFGFLVFLAFVAIAIAPVIAIVAAVESAERLLGGLTDFLRGVRRRLGARMSN